MARARVLLAQGRGPDAAQRAISAVSSFTSVGARYEVAAGQLLVGQAWSAAGRADAAIDVLERSVALAEACGAKRIREEGVRELRTLGRRIARNTPRSAGERALTGREAEIAELLSQGLTSRQIATALFLSKRTVETHVSHIYAKLGVTSRAALATAWASRNPP